MQRRLFPVRQRDVRRAARTADNTDGGLPTTTAIAIATGFEHACAVAADKSVRCWGDNSSLQLGNAAAVEGGPHPVAVTGINDASAVAAGIQHTCAIVSGAEVKCWGDNTYGELGSGNITLPTSTPVTVKALTGVTAIALGERHTCAIASGGVQCWGDNEYGQLGVGSAQRNTTAPIAVPSLSTGVTAIGADGRHDVRAEERTYLLLGQQRRRTNR